MSAELRQSIASPPAQFCRVFRVFGVFSALRVHITAHDGPDFSSGPSFWIVMPLLNVDFHDPDRNEHPLDVVERLASLRDWIFDRAETDEMSVTSPGRWTDYNVAFTWIEDVEALHVACAFDLKVPDRQRIEVMRLVALINEQLWVGHFDLWSSDSVVMFRHALLLTGGAVPTHPQCATMMKTAVDACERYYQAFQFVLWAGKSAREALDAVLFETEGEA